MEIQNNKIWLWNKDNFPNLDVFSMTTLKMGSSAKGKIDFASFKTKEELGDAYRQVVGNTDVSIPDMYWKFMTEVKIGDIVAVFSTFKDGKTQGHWLFGWGTFTSECKFVADDNPIQRDVKWHLPSLSSPIKDTKTKNSKYFHCVDGIEAANIKYLLGINKQSNTTSMNIQHYKTLLEKTHNLILTGAPGTGKTYLARQIAEAMGAEFDFVQFHPSYDYTDFVEGLRPIQDDNGNVGFERKDGVFKAFCAKALINQSADSKIINELNPNPIVWKVSLAGTGDNPVRQDCMDNGYVRIGWSEYGNVEDFNDFDNWSNGGKYVLRYFQSEMKEGDIIVSCYSAKEVDAIGMVAGEYEYRENGGTYPRYRKVKWLVKNIRENIVDINGNRSFTLPTVYKSNITVADALKIVQKYNKTTTTPNRPFVFIIDEINRGEISKIFGELFFSIDPGYRGEKGRVQTQYQNIVEDGDIFKKGFFVPENVYIIGTMNDIDRSVESMDFAFRRRFAFKEIKADENVGMLDNLAQKGSAIKRMKNLNAAIEKVDGLSSAYHIGASYFLKLKDYNGDFDKLWEYHLEGLLREYLRGTQDVDNEIGKLKTAYNDESDHNNGQPQQAN